MAYTVDKIDTNGQWVHTHKKMLGYVYNSVAGSTWPKLGW